MRTGQPRLPAFGHESLPSLLDAERGPAAVLLELPQELRARQGPLAADELVPEGLHERGGAHLADAEEPLDIAPGEELSVELLELADSVGMASSHRSFPGTVEVLSARWAAVLSGGVNVFARVTSAGTSTRSTTRLWPLRLPVYGRRGPGDPDAQVAAGSARAPEGHDGFVDLGRQTLDPSGGSAAEAVVPRANRWRRIGLLRCRRRPHSSGSPIGPRPGRRNPSSD